MKKRMFLLLGAVAGCILLSGCQVAYSTGFGFGATMPAVIITDQTRGGFILPKLESLAGVEVLGKVEGRSKSRNILMLLAEGDSGINAAKKDALIKYPTADDIVNIEIDTHHKSTFGLINESTTILRGIAIKYINK